MPASGNIKILYNEDRYNSSAAGALRFLISSSSTSKMSVAPPCVVQANAAKAVSYSWSQSTIADRKHAEGCIASDMARARYE
jgi:hypothetical protein